MSADTVSVVIPCYRQAHYLAGAIESCLRQTHPPLEIIVVDDGSDDDTEAVARRFGTQIVYHRRVNGGLAAARNSGIALAHGTYIKFLDADDHLAHEQLAWQVEALAWRTHAVAMTSLRAYEEDEPARYTDFRATIEELLPDLLAHPDSGIHAFLFPLRLVRAVGGFNERLRVAEDWDFLCRLGCLRVRVVCDERIGAYYRLRSGSMSTNKLAMAETVARLLIGLHDRFRRGQESDWFGRELLESEQRAYRRLLKLRSGDDELRRQLLTRIDELSNLVGRTTHGFKFDTLCRFIGYAKAEQLRVVYGRARLRLRNRRAGKVVRG